MHRRRQPRRRPSDDRGLMARTPGPGRARRQRRSRSRGGRCSRSSTCRNSSATSSASRSCSRCCSPTCSAARWPARPTATCSSCCPARSRWPSCSSPSTAASPSTRDLATGAFDRFRSMPVWRPAPILGALIGDIGRYLLAAGLVIGLGLAMGYHAGRRRRRGPRRDRARRAVRLGPVVGLDHARAGPALAERRDEHRLRDPVPRHVHEQRLRRPRDHARLAARRRATPTRSATSSPPRGR